MDGSFYAVNSKIGILKKGILTESDYEKILEFSKREEILNYIKDNPIYSSVIKGSLEEALENRYATEFMIHKAEAKAFKKLRSFLIADSKHILDAMLLRYEFEDIKIILRGIVEDEYVDLEKETIMYGFENHIDYNKLSKCDNLSQAIDMLKLTMFKRAVMSLADEDLQRLHFHVEMNLDSLYFDYVKMSYMRLSANNRKILQDYNADLVDTINIQWILRAKRYYNLSNEEIYNYSIRYGRKIKGDMLKRLVYSESSTDVIEQLKGTKFEKIFENINDSSTYRNIQKYVYDKHLKNLSSYQNTISTLLKFVIQVLIQSDNLIRIAEAKKYNLSKEETKKFLI